MFKVDQVEKVLKKLAVDLEDETVKEYIINILINEDDEDEETIVDIISPFLGNENEKLARQIVKELHQAETPVISNTNNVTKQIPKTCLMENENFDHHQVSLDSHDETQSENKYATTKEEKKSSRIAERKARKMQQKKKKKEMKQENSVSDAVEDESSAWQECQNSNQLWGGRGRGGRGEYAARVNSVKSNIHLTNVSVTLPNGNDLLQSATMDIARGHRYGLIGRNGVGKSTLLRRLASRSIPGMPHDMRTLLVEQQQEILEHEEKSALHALVEADEYRTYLLEEQERIEGIIECQNNEEELAQAVELLGDVAAELDTIEADTAPDRALEILKGLQFTNSMINGPVSSLSGGWRMRLAIAKALFVSDADLLCLDECTNHLDLYGLDWLIQYLVQSDKTLIVVSHDRVFLDAICTDIMVLEHQKLNYFPGNYSMYQQQQQEKAARDAQILDASERQRAKAQAFVQKQLQAANKKSADPNKQRQAKMIREKKMDRMGNYREDGKRYKQFSLKTLDEKSVRLAQKVQIDVDEPVIQMNFPNPTWPPSIGPNDSIVRLDDVSFGYSHDKLIFQDITLSINRGSKVALVGKNGCGKSSLVKLISGDHKDDSVSTKGEVWIHPNVRVGHITQYAVEELETYATETVVEYAEKRLKHGRISADIIAKASGNVRQYLGAFGLGGKHSQQLVGKLSGGERMRLCFATVLSDGPQLLLLDESTNHVDLETLESMSTALNDFDGSVLMVSHNQAFLSGFCKELWVLDDGHITINHSDTESFDEIFSQYRNSIMSGMSNNTDRRRRQKADMAKKATKQRSGMKQNAALL